jgi:hypothetical protein
VSSILTDRMFHYVGTANEVLAPLNICSSLFAIALVPFTHARLVQSIERKALNLVVVGPSPTVGDACTLS